MPTNSMRVALVQAMLSSGFAEKTYEGQEGVFISKTLKVRNMPIFSKQIVDNDSFFKDSVFIVELCPDNQVQICSGLKEPSDYCEVYDAFSEEGLALLKDAGLEGAPDFVEKSRPKM